MKRGLSHVEAILSFLLFIGFLLAGLYFFNPVDTNRLLDSTLSYAQNEIIKNTTSQVIVYGVVLNESVPQIISVVTPGLNDNLMNARVEGVRGGALSSHKEGSEITLDRSQNNFIYIILGSFPSIDQIIEGTSTRLVIGRDYQISTTDKQERADESRLIALKNAYNSSYGELKHSFNLPQRVDLAFKVTFADGEEINAAREIPEGVEVFTQPKSLEVIREDGSLAQATLYVSVW